MSLEAVQTYFSEFGMADRIIVLEISTATVETAARAHQVEPDQIGKTLAFKLKDKAILVVVSGKSRVDSKKYKLQFSHKSKMLKADEVLRETGHAVGGVCPFGLKQPLDVYLDISLKRHAELMPAAGNQHSAIRLTLSEIEKYSNPKAWVDVCK